MPVTRGTEAGITVKNDVATESGVVVGSSVDKAVEGEAVIDKAILADLQRNYVSKDFHNTQREKNEKSSMSVRIYRLEQYAQVIENQSASCPTYACTRMHAKLDQILVCLELERVLPVLPSRPVPPLSGL
jgi:hypothetical protein